MRVGAAGSGLRVEDTGGGPRVFLCLHGLVDRLGIWDACLPALRSRGRTVRMDQRGHGDSDAPPGPYSRADLAGDVARVLDALDIGSAILVGHSMGGVVAIEAALRHPDRVAGLVLLGTTGRCNEKVAGWYERIARAGEEEAIEGLRRAIYGEKSRKEILGDARGIAHVTRMLASLHPDPLTPKLAELRIPALLLVGERDPMGPKASELLAAKLVDAELRVLEDCGHWVHVERPAALAQALDPWLESHDL